MQMLLINIQLQSLLKTFTVIEYNISLSKLALENVKWIKTILLLS